MLEFIVQVINGVVIVTTLIISQSGSEGGEENAPPEPAHCYEWLNDGWQDICL